MMRLKDLTHVNIRQYMASRGGVWPRLLDEPKRARDVNPLPRVKPRRHQNR